ncbi:MAG: hypothetical protein WC486_00355 [Candidatus Omnitrophota bacterium]
MKEYSCINCINLKTRVVKARSIGNLSMREVAAAVKRQDVESLKLKFPLNFSVYKRLKRDKECAIVYCAEHMCQRDLYIYRNNIKNTVSMSQPCTKYR